MLPTEVQSGTIGEPVRNAGTLIFQLGFKIRREIVKNLEPHNLIEKVGRYFFCLISGHGDRIRGRLHAKHMLQTELPSWQVWRYTGYIGQKP